MIDIKQIQKILSGNLSDKEAEFLRVHFELANENCGAVSIDDLLEDNFSCATIEDFQRELDLDKHQISGLISSLEKKGIIWMEDREDEGLPNLYWISDEWLKEQPNDFEICK